MTLIHCCSCPISSLCVDFDGCSTVRNKFPENNLKDIQIAIPIELMC